MNHNPLRTYLGQIKTAGRDGLDQTAELIMDVNLKNLGSTLSLELFGSDKPKFDEKTVLDYLKVITRQDVMMINRWTSHADVPIKDLITFANKIKHVEPIGQLQVYRGIGFNLSHQDKMDLYDKKFLMYFLKSGVKPGYVTTYATPRPLSFTDDLSTAKAFGSTIVTTVLDKTTKYLRITQAFWEAVNRIDATSLFQETILLEINKPIKYTVLQT